MKKLLLVLGIAVLLMSITVYAYEYTTTVEQARSLIVADANVWHDRPDENWQGGFLDERTDDIDRRVWINFDLSKLGATQIITAKLYVYINTNHAYLNPNYRQLNYHTSLDDNWDENIVTWNNKPNTKEIITDYVMLPNQNLWEWYTFDLTLDARNSLNNDETFSGEIRFDDENDYWATNQLLSKEYELDITKRPYLMVTYETEPHPLEERVSLLEYYINMIICQLIPKGLAKDISCPV